MLAILALAAAPAHAEIGVFGAGLNSCAKAWAPAHERDSFVWVMGYWSGMNWAREAQVGGQTDAEGVVGEVKAICSSQPSMLLAPATAKAYSAMSK